MKRRNFVKLITVSGAAITFAGFDVGCKKGNNDLAHEAWDPEKLAVNYDDFRLRILSYAILAPSPHNTQPWKIRLIDTNKILLYVDPDRLLPMTDPFHRQIYIGQGTFLEILNIAARTLGYEAEIQLFPDGQDAVENTGKSPVAFISFHKSEPYKDVLFEYITKRATNRLVYNETIPEENQLRTLNDIFNDGNAFIRFFTDKTIVARMGDLMTEAMKIETYLHRTHAETVSMIRFTDEEMEKYRDGFGYENMGLSGMSKFFAETFAGRNKAFDESFKEKTVSVTEKMTHSAKALGILFSKENERTDQVEIGRKYSRVHLSATQLGLAMHPMTQITQEYEELSSVRKKFAEVIGNEQGVAQMVIRLGFADTVPHAPRRSVKDLIRS